MKSSPFDPLECFESKETVLNLVKEVFEFTISPHEFASFSFNVRHEFAQYLIQIQREMFGEKVQKEVVVKTEQSFPKTWWQHFKQENFPAWLLRKFPVKYQVHTVSKTVQFDRTFIFPDAYKEGHTILGKFIIRDYHRIP